MLQNALVVVAIGAAVGKNSLVVQNAAECIACRRKRRGASFDLQTFKHISKLVKNITMIRIIHFSGPIHKFVLKQANEVVLILRPFSGQESGFKKWGINST